MLRWFMASIMMLSLGLAAGLSPSSADSTTGVSADSFVREFNPTQTNGSATTLLVHNNTGFRKYAFVKVTHATVPGTESLTAASLRVYLTGTVPTGATLRADLVDNNWTEAAVNWNNQPALISTGPSTVTAAAGWNSIPIAATPSTTQSYRVVTNVTSGDVNISSRENGNGNEPEVFFDTEVIPVQTPTATRGSTACGVVDVDYATGASDNTASTFVTTVDGSTVDTEVVSAPSGTGGYGPASLTEDSSGGSADVVVNANGGAAELSFSVDTDCVQPWPPTSPIDPKIFGMSAPVNEWDSRLSDVGACGIEARRIFVSDASSDWSSKFNLIEDVVEDGMIPVISVKSNVSNFINGNYDTVYDNIRDDLISLDAQVTMTWWHEPHGDMTASQFRTASAHFFDLMDHEDIAVGPILNGWLLDNQTSTFAGYTNAGLLDDWEFMGVDTYQAGTDSNPDPNKPGGRAVPLVETWLDGQGYGDMPIVVGEYNGWTATSIDYGGDQLRLTDEVWIGLIWNSGPTGLGKPLEGQRLTEYIEDKAASEVFHDNCTP